MNELVDAAIVDWRLEGESGIALLLELRDLVPGMVMCLVTAGSVDDVALEAAAAGACVIAQKSVGPTRLLNAMIAHHGIAPTLLKSKPIQLPAELQGAPLAQVEREHILRTLQSVKGNVTSAARVLGVSRSSLNERLQRYERDDECPESGHARKDLHGSSRALRK